MITCRLESGELVSFRHTTVDALLVRSSRVVLCRRAAGLPEAGLWSLPGGYVERGETVVGALHREVREEIGVEVKSARIFAVVSNPERDVLERQNISLVFLVERWEGELRTSSEVSEFDFFRLDDLPESRHMAADHRCILATYFAWVQEPVALPFVDSN